MAAARVNSEAEWQVRLFGAEMRPLNDGLIDIGCNEPKIFRLVLTNARPAAGRRRPLDQGQFN